MQVVTRYKANDGSIWESIKDCEFRDKMILQVGDAMALLKKTPSELNWKGYVQQESSVVRRVKEKLFCIANQEGVLAWWVRSQMDEHGKSIEDLIDCHPSWLGRMLDGNHSPLASAYHRICSIDSQFREWNQPYYAMNPGAGELICVG